MSTFVIYHANCVDGFASATVCFRKFERTAHYIPCNYGTSLDSIIKENNIQLHDEIFMVDFSFPREQLIKCPNKIVILDHHATAKENLVDLPINILAKFDMTKCGCILAWEYFFDTMYPAPLLYIQDRDLWKWELPDSKAFNAGLSLFSKENTNANLDYWSARLLTQMPTMGTFFNDGRIVLLYQQQLIDNACKQAKIVKINPQDADADERLVIEILAVNSPILQSEICDQLIKNNTKENIAACYWHDLKINEIVWSVRSRNKGGMENARTIATRFGGGGHDQAAGFKVKELPRP